VAGKLNGKVAIITGASAGIGQASARALAREGAKLVLTARRQGRLDALIKEVRALGGDGVAVIGDAREEETALEAVEADMIRLAFGRYRGRMTEIAKRLGIGRSTLYRKMREIGLEARVN